jgi:hypothetical protein
MNVLLWESFLNQEEGLDQSKRPEAYKILQSGKEYEIV